MARGDELDFSKPARVFYTELDSTIAYNKKRISVAGSNFFRVGSLPLSMENVTIAMQRDNVGSFVPYFSGEGVHTGDSSRESLDALFITSEAQPAGSAPIIIKYGTYPIGALIFNRLPLQTPTLRPRILQFAIQINNSVARTDLLSPGAGNFLHVTRLWYKCATKVNGGWNLEVYFDNAANYIASGLDDRVGIFRNPFTQGLLEPKSHPSLIFGSTGPTSPNIGDELSVRMDVAIADDLFVGLDYYLTQDGVSR
jgi:hypothetical protein